VKLIFKDPKAFFDMVAPEPTIWRAYWCWAVLAGIMTALTLPINYLSMKDAGGAMASGGGFLFAFLVVMSVVSVFFGQFIMAGVTHLGVLIVGGKKGFVSTFKAVVYPYLVSAGYMLISIPLAFISFALTKGSPVQMMEVMKQSFPVFIIFALSMVVGLANFVHMIHVGIVGLKRLQDLSTGRAVVALIVIPLVIIFVLALILIFIGALFIAAMYGPKVMPTVT
jgi:hypothetical protein